MPLPYGREVFVQLSKFVRLSHSQPPLMHNRREGGIPATARDHSCPGHCGAATVVCPEAGRGGEEKGKIGCHQWGHKAPVIVSLSHGPQLCKQKVT